MQMNEVGYSRECCTWCIDQITHLSIMHTFSTPLPIKQLLFVCSFVSQNSSILKHAFDCGSFFLSSFLFLSFPFLPACLPACLPASLPSFSLSHPHVQFISLTPHFQLVYKKHDRPIITLLEGGGWVHTIGRAYDQEFTVSAGNQIK